MGGARTCKIFSPESGCGSGNLKIQGLIEKLYFLNLILEKMATIYILFLPLQLKSAEFIFCAGFIIKFWRNHLLNAVKAGLHTSR